MDLHIHPALALGIAMIDRETVERSQLKTLPTREEPLPALSCIWSTIAPERAGDENLRALPESLGHQEGKEKHAEWDTDLGS